MTLRNTVPVALFLALALALTGCFQHTFEIGTGAPDGEIVYQHWHHHWLFGLLRPDLQKQLDVAEICPSGNATIHEEVSFVNGLIDVLIGVIYSPTTVTIRCEDGRQATIELSEETVATIVDDPRFPGLVEELAPQRRAAVESALAGRCQGTDGLPAVLPAP